MFHHHSETQTQEQKQDANSITFFRHKWLVHARNKLTKQLSAPWEFRNLDPRIKSPMLCLWAKGAYFILYLVM